MEKVNITLVKYLKINCKVIYLVAYYLKIFSFNSYLFLIKLIY